MTDVRLDRTDRAGLPIDRILVEGAGEARNLDRIAELRSSPVGLDVTDAPRVHATALERRCD